MMNFIKYNFYLHDILLYDESYDFSLCPINIFSENSLSVGINNFGFKAGHKYYSIIIKHLNDKYKIKVRKQKSFLKGFSLEFTYEFKDDLAADDFIDINGKIYISPNNSKSKWTISIVESIKCLNNILKNLVIQNSLNYSKYIISLNPQNYTNLIENHFNSLIYMGKKYESDEIAFEEKETKANLLKPIKNKDIFLKVNSIKINQNKDDLFYDYLIFSWKMFEEKNYRNAIIELDIAVDILVKKILKKLIFRINKKLINFHDKLLDKISVGDSLKQIKILLPNENINPLIENHETRNTIIHQKQRKIQNANIITYKDAIKEAKRLYAKY